MAVGGGGLIGGHGSLVILHEGLVVDAVHVHANPVGAVDAVHGRRRAMLGVCARGTGSTATLLLLLLQLLLLWMWLLLSVLHLDGLPLLLCHTLSLKHHLGVRLWLLVTLHGHSLLALHLLHLRHLSWVVHLSLHHLLLIRLHAVLWHLHASLWRPVACAGSRSVAITIGKLAVLDRVGAWSAWCLALSWLSWAGLLHHGSLVVVSWSSVMCPTSLTLRRGSF